MEENRQMQQYQRSGARHAGNFAEIALRGTALLWDLQLEAVRNMWHAQARSAAMLGVPDYSHLFFVADERARRVFSTGAEQLFTTARHATETLSEVQHELGRLVEEQTIGITEEIRQRIEELGRRTEEGIEEIHRLARQNVGEAKRAMEETVAAASAAAGQTGEAAAAAGSAPAREPAANQPHSETEGRSEDRARRRTA